MKTVITILFWVALLTAFSVHGAKTVKDTKSEVSVGK